MDIMKEPLSPAELKWCKDWLKSYTNVIDCLTNINEFTEYTLGKMIHYEAMHEQREELLTRLTARHNKLRRRREWVELTNFMGDFNALTDRDREENRKALVH